jgi:hypothetical protein
MCVYDNAQTVTSYGQTSAVMKIDEVSERISLIVVDDYIQKYDIIVGRTFTDCENVSFIKNKDRLLFTYGMRFPFEEEDNICGNLVKYGAKIVRDTKILPPKSASMVKVKVNNEQIEIMLINDNVIETTLSKGVKLAI